MKKICCLLFVFLAFTTYSQNLFKGTVVDRKTRKPLPYASIKLNNNKLQSMANADGCYALPEDIYLKNDTLLVSCVGYRLKRIPVRTLKGSSVIELDPVVYQLNPVNISGKGNTDYPYQLFDEISKKYRKAGLVKHSKGYFCFLSRLDELPLEIIEEYFNCNVSCNTGISKLVLKDGRLGLCNSRFYSLSTTDILTDFSLFSLSGNRNIPSSPGNFLYHGLKKVYDIKIVKTSVENGEKKFILEFHPKKDSTTLFSGFAWINKDDNTIEKIEYHLNVSDFYYLKPVISGDKIDAIELTLQYTFDNSDRNNPGILYAALDYSLLYFSKRQSNTIKVSSEGNLMFYDESNPFPEIIPADLFDDQINDYQRISCIPYDSLFWANPGITPQSDKQRQFIDFFHSNGVLINFSKTMDSITGSNYIHWSATSDLSSADILNKPPAVHVSPNGSAYVNAKNPSFYDIDCRILINPVEIGDSLHINSVTLLNWVKSYYCIGHDFKAAVFLNLTFDLYEKKRREIMAKYNQASKSHKITFSELQSVYNSEMSQLKDTIKIFQDETNNGKDTAALLKWYKFINQETGIDRHTLINNFLVEEANLKVKK